jgi:hypothetical protein
MKTIEFIILLTFLRLIVPFGLLLLVGEWLRVRQAHRAGK